MKRASEVLAFNGVQAFHAHLYNLEQAVSFLLGHSSDLELSEETTDALYKMIEVHGDLGEGQALDWYK